MKNIFSRLPKKGLLALALIVTVLGLATGVKAYYPERPTFTTAVPADHVTFNSITDNPREGDERAFFSIKDDANKNSDGFLHKTTVKDGQTVLLRVYVHNNAADNLNGANLDGKGVAKNTKVRVYLPSVTDTTLRANAYVSADNADPQVVSDTADFIAPTTANKFSISYVPGSAVAYNNFAGANGLKLSDSIVGDGALLGEQTANGVVPGCFKYVNVVTLKVKVHMQTPNFSLEKGVALPGASAYTKSVTAKPGDTVNYQLAFKNTGNSQLNNVVLRDQLPSGVNIVSGSAKLYDSVSNGAAQSDAIVANGGQNIGSYTSGANAYFRFKATLPTADKLKCGVNTLTNIGQAIVGGQDMTDTATVTINKDCTPPPTSNPVYSCNLLSLTRNGRVVTANVAYTATNGATLKTVTYNFGEGTKSVVVTDKTSYSYTYSDDAAHAVSVSLAFQTSNGDVSGITSTGCTQIIPAIPTTPGTPTTPTTPTELPNTGAGNVIGIAAGAIIVGTLVGRLFLSRKIARNI